MSDGRGEGEERPVWDGQGVDPWLPARLRDSAEIAAAEREMFQGFWAILAQFLVAATRALLAAPTPDPQQLLSQQSLWDRLVAEFVQTTVLDVMGRAYRAIFGPDVRYSARPAVLAHLAVVDNRLRDVDNEVFDRVAATVARGTQEGWTADDTRKAVQQELGPENTHWKNRAAVVARTETIGALNAGRTDSFNQISSDHPELQLDQQWLATLDTRVRATHRRADGQRRRPGRPFDVGGAELRFPGDPRGPAREVIQCRCTTILVERGREVNLSGRGWTLDNG